MFEKVEIFASIIVLIFFFEVSEARPGLEFIM